MNKPVVVAAITELLARYLRNKKTFPIGETEKLIAVGKVTNNHIEVLVGPEKEPVHFTITVRSKGGPRALPRLRSPRRHW